MRKRQVLVQTDLVQAPLPVLADRALLHQVIANLVKNAIEAMDAVDERSRTLRVKSAVGDPEVALITVEDSGPGIASENVERIFHPFFTTKTQGMGMGLSICRAIVESHDGRLSARSDANRGAVFQIELPSAAEVADAE